MNEHAAPEVACRDAEPGEIPTRAVALAVLAQSHGWVVWSTYARGSTQATRRSPSTVVASIAVRLRRGEQLLVAVWEADRFAYGVSRFGTTLNLGEIKREIQR